MITLQIIIELFKIGSGKKGLAMNIIGKRTGLAAHPFYQMPPVNRRVIRTYIPH